MKNSEYPANAIVSICANKLGIEFRAKKHYSGWFSLDGEKAVRLTVPLGRKSVPRGTYSAMARQLELRVSEFDRLLDCPLDRAEYVGLLRARKK